MKPNFVKPGIAIALGFLVFCVWLIVFAVRPLHSRKKEDTVAATSARLQQEAAERQRQIATQAQQRKELVEQARQARERQLATLPAKARKLCHEHEGWTLEECTNVANRQIWIGMPKEMLIASWGEPDSKNVTVTETSQMEQWVYGYSYVYFHNSPVVTGAHIAQQPVRHRPLRHFVPKHSRSGQ